MEGIIRPRRTCYESLLTRPPTKMDVDDHDSHYEFMYYPSNVFVVGSDEEFSFFKNKWNTKSDRKRVRRIYEDFRKIESCPCRALLAFNVLEACEYRDEKLAALSICETTSEAASINRFTFTNEYQLKTAFFSKRFDENVRNTNVRFIRETLGGLVKRCGFAPETRSGGCGSSGGIDKTKKAYKKPVQNKRKMEKFEPTARKALEIAASLVKDVARINHLARFESSAALYRLCATLRKRARQKYLKLDYFRRFGAILSNVDMYLPKLSKNKAFKKNREIVRERLRDDCLRFWGIAQQRRSLMNGRSNYDSEENVVLGGQLLPVNDNPSHVWYNLSSRCKHDGGTRVVHVQTRCNDEMVSTFTFCNLCNRRV